MNGPVTIIAKFLAGKKSFSHHVVKRVKCIFDRDFRLGQVILCYNRLTYSLSQRGEIYSQGAFIVIYTIHMYLHLIKTFLQFQSYDIQ